MHAHRNGGCTWSPMARRPVQPPYGVRSNKATMRVRRVQGPGRGGFCEQAAFSVYLYLIVFVFTFLSQTQYFNPIFLLFGYHYYHILTDQGTQVFVITKGRVIRNKTNITFKNLRRINDTTYIQGEKR